MKDNLVVFVLGHRNSGKSRTWKTLFDRDVRTGTHTRDLILLNNDCVDVFLINGSPQETGRCVEVFIVNGSPQETGKPIENMLGGQVPRIVLCSIQYTPDAINTINYFKDRGDYEIYCQWLNPGRNDPSIAAYDGLGLMNYLLSIEATVNMQNGQIPVENRVQLIRSYIYGWAKYRGLVK